MNDKFAIIEQGGRQYKVRVNDVIVVERSENEVSSTFDASKVLAISDGNGGVEVGNSLVGKAVKLYVVENMRGDKVVIFKKKRRKNHQKMNTHRQNYQRIKIESIA